MNYVLGGRSIGAVLGRSAGSAAVPAWLAGGINPANCVAAYQPIGAASLAASYVNLANPGTYNAAPGVAPTWAAATGWTSDGTQYLTTGIVPAAGWSAIVRFSNRAAVDRYLFGIIRTNARFTISPSLGYGPVRYSYGSAARETSPGLTSGILAIAGADCYRNGAADGTGAGVFSGAAVAMMIFGYSTNGSNVAAIFAGSIQALYIYNTTLSALQNAEVSVAMAALP